eukprot:6457073-Amphidinium_carterae.1
MNFGLVFAFWGEVGSESVHESIQCFTDASFAPDGEGSHTGVVLRLTFLAEDPGKNEADDHFWGFVPHVVAWSSKKQKTLIAQSTAESEIVAASTGYSLSLPLSMVMSEMSQKGARTVIYIHNSAAISIVSTPAQIQPWRSRHISIRGEKLRNDIVSKKVCARYAPTKFQIADVMTKFLGRAPSFNSAALFGRQRVDQPEADDESQEASEHDLIMRLHSLLSKFQLKTTRKEKRKSLRN